MPSWSVGMLLWSCRCLLCRLWACWRCPLCRSCGSNSFRVLGTCCRLARSLPTTNMHVPTSGQRYQDISQGCRVCSVPFCSAVRSGHRTRGWTECCANRKPGCETPLVECNVAPYDWVMPHTSRASYADDTHTHANTTSGIRRNCGLCGAKGHILEGYRAKHLTRDVFTMRSSIKGRCWEKKTIPYILNVQRCINASRRAQSIRVWRKRRCK